ncbi:unnamed protein product, partial [Phaeothamnion confervicola]
TAQLLAAHFLTLVIQFLLTTTLIFTKVPLISALLNINDSAAERDEVYERWNTWLTALISTAIILAIVELGLLLSGATLPRTGFSCAAATTHAVGSMFLLSMQLNGWGIDTYLVVFVLCSVLPATAAAAPPAFRLYARGKVLEAVEIRI